MGKPYDHTYFFAGPVNSCGGMVCAKCNQPVFNHAHDWMAYKKQSRDDWGYVCFHRKYYADQSGWIKIEKANEKEAAICVALTSAITTLCNQFGLTANQLFNFIEDDYLPDAKEDV